MKIIFMGTPEFAAPGLQAIWESSHTVLAVVTAPDKPVGRGLKIKPSPIKQLALDYEIPVLQPEKLSDPEFINQLIDFQADLFVVVAFRILPKSVFSIPAQGTINLHASLLPSYRGAAPINWALINGEPETGVSIFFIEKQVDTGNIILQEKVPILPDETAGSLHDKMMAIGAEVLVEAIDMIEEHEVEPIIQTGAVTSAPKINKEMCRISWDDSAIKIHNLVRGLSPHPGAVTSLKNKILKIFATQPLELTPPEGALPGTIIDLNTKSGLIAVVTGDGVLSLRELQFEGKKCMCSSEFLKGCRFETGEMLL
jgi:methionyl-tRNA formyltransferase